MNNQQLGRLGEDAAIQYLMTGGYRILCRNFRCRAGELDIVASKGDVLHFIEVKTRRGNAFGHPAESVTDRKIGCMKGAACRYMSEMRRRTILPQQMQFDVIEIEINHIQNIG